VFNDWQALALLLQRLDGCLSGYERVEVVLIDDGSTQPPGVHLEGLALRQIARVLRLPLRRNLGHQRAIAVGLCWIEQNLPDCDAVVVMDADGEDAPADVPRLIDKLIEQHRRAIVFAKRTKRSESTVFRVCYHTYRVVHHLLTGIRVSVGNFSVIPRPLLRRIVVLSELWNHYAAAIVKSRMPTDSVDTQRAHRLHGQSTMNFVALVTHGLSAISVFSDRVGVRLVIGISFIASAIAVALGVILVIRLGTDLAVPGWATYTTGILLILLAQMFLLLLVSVFAILAGRQSADVIPARDFVYFIDQPEAVYGGE